ncbi:MAG TPA: hypothetical protein VNQ73_16460 [Ilumatobacter sp.]|nr:hypothetical protein [Ilumatobacter sp.]
MINRSTEIADHVGRTLEGIAYKYNHPSRVTDDGWHSSYYEELLRGSDARTLSHRAAFPLTRLHSAHGGVAVGEVSFHRSDNERALLFRAVVDLGRDGDDLLAEIDQWRDASVTFDPLRTTYRSTQYHGRITQRAEIRLAELALSPVGTGLAAGAEVTLVRSVQPGTPRLDELRRRRQSLAL